VWPRGRSKDELRLDAWYKELAPSTALRKWFGHDPERWAEFKKRYKEELRSEAAVDAMGRLLHEAGRKSITLVYGAKDEEHNQAIVLREVLQHVRPR
jgi:uncharacterized protein YeaO (DUF488 family)